MVDNVLSPEARFWKNIQVDEITGCWLWQHKLRSDGYARFKVNQKSVYVHCWAYEIFINQIPQGLELDHLCSVRHCCNPLHLEPVTHKENCSRGRVNQFKGKTHCIKGHLFDAKNTRITKRGHRICRMCQKEWQQRNNGFMEKGSRKVCKRGHPFDETNTYIDPRGNKNCKECQRDRCRQYFTRREEVI